jgi:hypothetical protein
MESEIGLGVGDEVVRLRRAAKRFYVFSQLLGGPNERRPLYRFLLN